MSSRSRSRRVSARRFSGRPGPRTSRRNGRLGTFPDSPRARSPPWRSARPGPTRYSRGTSDDHRKEQAVSEAPEEVVPKPSGLGSMRRKAVEVTELVQTSTMGDSLLPLVARPSMDGVDLTAWAASHRDEIDGWYDKHGAILFRGFGLSGVEDFESVASAIAGELFKEYGDLPPESASQAVYGVTPYPADKMILFHNESSHLPTWPMRQFFFCVIPSETGGTTPLLDCRAVYNAMDPAMEYIRNLYEELCVDFVWEPGDLAAVDNMLVQHARRPYTGERKLYVALAKMSGLHELAGAA